MSIKFVSKKTRFRVWLSTTWILAILLVTRSAASTVDGFGDFCADATPMALNSVQEVYQDGQNEDHFFLVDVASPGVLILEVADLAQRFSGAKIGLISKDCARITAEHVAYVEHSGPRQVVKVDVPGAYFLRVHTEPDHSWRTYRMLAAFSEGIPVELNPSGFDLESGNPATPEGIEEWDEDDISQNIQVPRPVEQIEEWDEDDISRNIRVPGPVEQIEEWDEDDISQNIRVPGTVAFDDDVVSIQIEQAGVLEIDATGRGLLALTESLRPRRDGSGSLASRLFTLSERILIPVRAGEHHVRWSGHDGSMESTPLRVTFFPVCGLAEPDDHGDSRACASEIRIGSRVSAEIAKVSATDLDYFSFIVADHETVSMETRGATDTFGQLLDDSGSLLAADDDGGSGANFRIVRSLCPGRYFLRVEGRGGSEGQYVLETGSRQSASEQAGLRR